jgi:hypothetical protein
MTRSGTSGTKNGDVTAGHLKTLYFPDMPTSLLTKSKRKPNPDSDANKAKKARSIPPLPPPAGGQDEEGRRATSQGDWPAPFDTSLAGRPAGRWQTLLLTCYFQRMARAFAGTAYALPEPPRAMALGSGVPIPQQAYRICAVGVAVAQLRSARSLCAGPGESTGTHAVSPRCGLRSSNFHVAICSCAVGVTAAQLRSVRSLRASPDESTGAKARLSPCSLASWL